MPTLNNKGFITFYVKKCEMNVILYYIFKETILLLLWKENTDSKVPLGINVGPWFNVFDNGNVWYSIPFKLK